MQLTIRLLHVYRLFQRMHTKLRTGQKPLFFPGSNEARLINKSVFESWNGQTGILKKTSVIVYDKQIEKP